MKRQTCVLFISFFMSVTLSVGCSVIAPETDRSNELLIKNVSIVSAERAAPTNPVDVLIHDNRIVEIGEALSEEDLENDKIIDATGLFLTPGLIDGHTHLNEIPGMLFEHEQAFPEIARAAHEQFPRSYLYYGFTTVVDLNSNSQAIAEWNERNLRPQAYFCGAAPIIDGYPMSNIPQPIRYQIMPYFLVDNSNSGQIPEGIDPIEHTPEAVVANLRADGAICVKTHYETGFGGSGNLPTPSVGLIQELVAVARSNNMPVLLHANSQSAQRFGIQAGVDAMAHGLWTWDKGAATELNEEIISILDGVIEQGIGWQPTIQVLYGERDLHDPNYLSQPALQDALPQSLIDWYTTEEGQWFRTRMANLPFIASLLEAGRWQQLDTDPIARVTEALSYLAANGGLLLFGSDTPSDATYANPPGLNSRIEMQRWQQAGISASQFFEAATIKNAAFFGLQNELGTVEVGKQADLLLLSENPLESIDAFDSIRTVILDGMVLPRAELSARHQE